jgi:cell division cycle protein 20 (cofactor of APC complex)
MAAAENRGTRTPLAPDPDTAARRERLFALKGRSPACRVLNIKQTSAGNSNQTIEPYWGAYTGSMSRSTTIKATTRKYPKAADKILDAPNIIDDFYLNVLDWSREGKLAIALGGVVYVLDTESGGSSSLCSTGSENTYISSVQWNKSGKYLAVGTSNAEVQLWDVNANKLVRRMHTHDSRVNSLAWNPHTSLLSSASQSGTVHNYDVRQAQFHINSLESHSRDVCGLRWSPNGRFLASGGDSNVVCIWDTHSRDPWTAPAHILREHTAAVKALSWCPWQPNLLASGGGSADRHICLWNACTGQLQDKVNTGSQISGLVWSSQHQELLSSHGHPHNELTIWSYPSLSHRASLRGHEARILHLVLSPDGQTVASAGADETLRFWKCFAASKAKKTEKGMANLSMSTLEMPSYIR